MGWSPKRYALALLIGVGLLQAGVKKPARKDRVERVPLRVNVRLPYAKKTTSTPRAYKGTLNEGFESGAIPSEWTVIDRDGDGSAWTAYNGASYAHTGSYSAAVAWNSSGNDDWLITPALLPQTGDSFTFWARSRSASYPEDFDVLVSTTTPDPDSFTVIDTVRQVPNTYTYYAYDLSSYAGETIYVAIRCVSVDEYYLHVDDVKGPEMYIVDTTGPAISVIQGPLPHFYTGSDDPVMAVITDISGVSSAYLYYSRDWGATWDTIGMTPVNGDTFYALLPAQSVGTKVLWAVVAADSLGNQSQSSTYYYTIMPSGDNLISFQDANEANPLLYGLIDNNIDPLPDYMFDTDFYTYQDSLSGWKTIFFGAISSLGDTMMDAFDKFLSSGNDTNRKSVVIFGDDIAYYAANNGYLEKLNSVFRVNYIKDDYSSSTNNDTIVGVSGDPISDSIPQFTVSSSYPDMVEPWSPWQGVDMPWKFLIATTGDSVNTAGGVAYNGLTRQVFYMPYEVSEIDSQSAVDTLIGRIYNFIQSNVLPPLPDWCGIQWPQADTVVLGVDTLSAMIYGQVYKSGVTDADTLSKDSFIVQLGVGPEGSMPNDTTWTWTNAIFNSAHGNSNNNYEYMAQIDLSSLTPGVYDYAFRFSYKGGPWVYADWGESGGSSDGYQPANAGKLYVTMGGAPVVSIYEVQDTTDTTFDADTSNLFGDTVMVFGVVTGVYPRGFFLQDKAGGPWSGVWIYLGSSSPYSVNRGDSVGVKGVVSEYNGLTEIEPDTVIVLASGVELPAPIVVSTGEANDEKYESVLLSVEKATCTNPNLGYGEWEINDGTGPLRVDDMGYAFVPDSGVKYNVTGPLYYSYGNYKLEPRDSNDISVFTYPRVIINEVYYDSPGTDQGIFVELKADPNTPLDNIHVWGINGNGGAVYNDVDLTGHIVGPSGYFVLAQDTTVPNADTITGLDYQNGPDNVVLVYIDGADTVVLDALGYGDFSSAVFAGEGSPAPDVASGLSLQRIPDGKDTDDNSQDFMGFEPTPGRKNATYVVFEDNFDTDTMKWIGNWAKTGATYHSPDSSFTDSPTGNYPDNATLIGEINQDIDLTSYFSAKMEFWTKYHVEQGWDSVHLQVSTDSGATWNDMKAYTGDVADWTKETIDLGAYAGKVIRVRFVLISDQAVNYDGMYVDDVVITGNAIDEGAPAIHHLPPAISDDILGDFNVIASIIDPSPIAIDSLYYKTDTMSDFVAISPDSILDTLYYFTIPGQEPGTRVDYYIVAADTAMNRTQTDTYYYYAGMKFIYDDGDPQYYMPLVTGDRLAVSVIAPQDTGVALYGMMVLHYYSPSQGVTGGAYAIHVYDNTFNDIITPDTVYEDTTEGNVFWKVIDLTSLNNGEPIYLSYNDTVYLGIEGIDSTVALMVDQPGNYHHTYWYNPDSSAWYQVDADLFVRGIGNYVSDVKENLNRPLRFAALAPMPNPFKGHTVIKFALPEKEKVTLDIYDISGRRVVRLLSGKLNAGWHTAIWNGRDSRGRRVKSGVYFYRLNAGKYRKTVKMMLVR